MMNENEKLSFLSLIGLGRRAGIIVIGQDRVLQAIKKRKKYVIILSSDRSDALARSILQLSTKSGHSTIYLENIDREEMGEALGLAHCQIVAIPSSNGLAKKISHQILEGGKIFE